MILVYLGRCISILPLPDNLKLVGILMSEAANLSESTWKRYISKFVMQI